MNEDIVKRIKIEMIKKGMSTKELAKQVGVTRSSIYNYFNGYRPFTFKFARQIIQMFPEANFKYEEFFDNDI